jgi:hypothetical protein
MTKIITPITPSIITKLIQLNLNSLKLDFKLKRLRDQMKKVPIQAIKISSFDPIVRTQEQHLMEQLPQLPPNMNVQMASNKLFVINPLENL